MKKLIALILIAAATLAFCGCAARKAECRMKSAEFVDNIPTNGIMVTYEGFDIYKVVFSVTLAEGFSGDGAKGDDFRQAIYSHINKGCGLTFDGGEGKQVWGYWPQKADQYSATEMTLFYTVPEGTEASALTFTLDGSVLGDAAYQFSYNP